MVTWMAWDATGVDVGARVAIGVESEGSNVETEPAGVEPAEHPPKARPAITRRMADGHPRNDVRIIGLPGLAFDERVTYDAGVS